MKPLTNLPHLLLLLLANSAIGQVDSANGEPILDQNNATALIEESSFEGWEVPSVDNWSIEDGIMTGDTNGQELAVPQWLYTENGWSDFIFTIEARITGSGPNSGVYFRARKINWRGRYEAATGYEYDFAEGNLNGSIGDFFSRPRFRIRADQEVLGEIYKIDDWNRLTVRVRENRVEYWMNGTKIQDYLDEDPNASKEGVIGLQLHDSIVMKAEFRNAYVLELEGDLDAPPSIVPGLGSFNPNTGEFKFALKGVSGKSYQIIASDQLEQDLETWFELGEPVTLVGNSIDITDSTATPPQRFYRARENP